MNWERDGRGIEFVRMHSLADAEAIMPVLEELITFLLQMERDRATVPGTISLAQLQQVLQYPAFLRAGGGHVGTPQQDTWRLVQEDERPRLCAVYGCPATAIGVRTHYFRMPHGGYSMGFYGECAAHHTPLEDAP